MQTLKMERVQYLDLQISKNQLIKFRLVNTNENLHSFVRRTFTSLKIYFDNINPFLEHMNNQCQMIHVKQFLSYFNMTHEILNLYLDEKTRTTDSLDFIQNIDQISKMTLYYFKCLNKIKKYNNPNSLLNLSMKIYIDKYIELPFHDNIDDYYDNLNIPESLRLKLQNNLIVNVRTLLTIDKKLQLTCHYIERTKNFTFCNKLINRYIKYHF
jgi:hypothetical protein